MSARNVDMLLNHELKPTQQPDSAARKRRAVDEDIENIDPKKMRFARSHDSPTQLPKLARRARVSSSFRDSVVDHSHAQPGQFLSKFSRFVGSPSSRDNSTVGGDRMQMLCRDLSNISIKPSRTSLHTKTSFSEGSRKVLLLGSDFSARRAANYILQYPSAVLTFAVRSSEKHDALCKKPLSSRERIISLNISNTRLLEHTVAAHNLVVSLDPFDLPVQVVRAAIKGGTDLVTACCVSPAVRQLEPEIMQAGISLVHEVSLDQGVEQLVVTKTVDDVHAKGGKVKKFASYAGNLPAPGSGLGPRRTIDPLRTSGPLKFMFYGGARDVLLSCLASSTFYQDGRIVSVAGGRDLTSIASPYHVWPALELDAYPVYDSRPYREELGIPEAETVIRGALRHRGFLPCVKLLANVGLLDQTPDDRLKNGMTYDELVRMRLGARDGTDAALVDRIQSLCGFSDVSDARLAVQWLRSLGLLSSERAVIRAGNVLDTVCARLEARWSYGGCQSDDMLLLEHSLLVEWMDGTESILKSTFRKYSSQTGYPAIVFAHGLPCGIAARLVLDGAISEKGIQTPYSEGVRDAFHAALGKAGIRFVQEGS